jgi:hypothetical protein
MVNVPVALSFNKQLLPCVVMVTTPPVALAVGVPQLLNPLPKATVGVAGTLKFELKVAVMVLLLPNRNPLDDALKLTVQVEEVLATVEAGVKATVDTELAEATPTPTRGAATAPMMIAGNNARSALITRPTSFVFVFIVVVRSFS